MCATPAGVFDRDVMYKRCENTAASASATSSNAPDATTLEFNPVAPAAAFGSHRHSHMRSGCLAD